MLHGMPAYAPALFLKKFLRHGTKIASVAPTSRWLANAMVSEVPFASANVIVELGAGTGPVTAELQQRMRPGSRLVAVEFDPEFCAHLRATFPGLDLVEGDATHLCEHLAARGIAQVDCIVSCLGTPALPKEAQERLFADVRRVLRPGGLFVQLTEFPLVFLPYYRKRFDDVAFHFVARNIPPSGYYVCRGPKETIA